MKNQGIYLGRFQPFHNQHLRVVREKILTDFPHIDLTVGVPDWKGEPYPRVFLTGDEAVTVVQLSLKDAGINNVGLLKAELTPEYDLEKIIYEIIVKEKFSHVFSGSERTLAATRGIISEHKLPLTVIDLEDDGGGTRATNIRELMVRGDDGWRDFVTPSAAEFLAGQHLVERLKSLAEGNLSFGPERRY